jgi:hypothetical protein
MAPRAILIDGETTLFEKSQEVEPERGASPETAAPKPEAS